MGTLKDVLTAPMIYRLAGRFKTTIMVGGVRKPGHVRSVLRDTVWAQMAGPATSAGPTVADASLQVVATETDYKLDI